jgi:hypothetical protein
MKGLICVFSQVRVKLMLPVAVLVAVLIFPASALAHERRTIAGGKYDVVVGWDVEPAYQGQKNAASIRISQAGSNPPVPIVGAEKTLSVQIRQGSDTHLFPLRTVFGQQGYYVADIVPTRAGDFQWTFVGNINGDAVNDTFDTADGKFNKVEPITGLQFPVALGDQSQVASTASIGQTIAAVSLLDSAGLHEIDEALTNGTDVPIAALGQVQNAYIVAAATQWPAPLKDQAAQLTSELARLATTLAAGDMNGAMTPAHDAHEMEHMLSHMAYDWLGAQAGIATPSMTGMPEDATADAN